MLLQSEFGQLLGGEYGVNYVAFDGRIGYLYVDYFVLVWSVLYSSGIKYDR